MSNSLCSTPLPGICAAAFCCQVVEVCQILTPFYNAGFAWTLCTIENSTAGPQWVVNSTLFNVIYIDQVPQCQCVGQ